MTNNFTNLPSNIQALAWQIAGTGVMNVYDCSRPDTVLIVEEMPSNENMVEKLQDLWYDWKGNRGEHLSLEQMITVLHKSYVF